MATGVPTVKICGIWLTPTCDVVQFTAVAVVTLAVGVTEEGVV